MRLLATASLLALAITPVAASATPIFSVAAPQCKLGAPCPITITKTGKATSYSDIAASTNGAAIASTTTTVRFLKADTVKTVYAQSVISGQFMATIKAARYGLIGQGTAVGTVVAPMPAPAAPPAPAPPPTGWTPSPSLDGLPGIPSQFNYMDSLQPSWGSGAIPVSAAPFPAGDPRNDVVGAFRFNCRDSGTNNDDPIVYPGQPGLSHGHQYYCHAGDAFTTYENLRAGAGSFNGTATKCVNCSSYWMPQMLDGAGNVVKPDFVSIYYKRRPASDPKCSLTSGDPKAEGNCVPIPNAIKFIFGYDMLTAKAPTGELWFNCQGPTATPGAYPNITVALANCPLGAGNKLGAVIKAPGCWDGKNIDSPNHRDHVAYPGYGDWGYLRCPLTHPYRIPDFTLGAWFPVAAGMHLSSDAMVPNAAPGTTFHADFFGAWDPTVKAMWTDNCINKLLNCSGGDLGNGLQLRNAQ